METRLTDLTFEEWLRHIFDHEVSEPRWYLVDLNAESWDGPTAVTVEYMTRLMQKPLAALVPYSDAQINQGLWYMVDINCSGCMVALKDDTVSLVKRIACVEAIFTLFRQLFAARCSPVHENPNVPENPLNRVCYMWWDLMPLTPAPHKGKITRLDSAVFEVLRKSLDLASSACQEAALHGLGPWARDYPNEVKIIIDSFLKKHKNLSPQLRQYALAAQSGSIM